MEIPTLSQWSGMGSLKDLALGPSPKNPGERRLWANPPGCGSPGRPGHLWLAVKVRCNLEWVEAAHTALQWPHAEGTLPLFKSKLPQAFGCRPLQDTTSALIGLVSSRSLSLTHIHAPHAFVTAFLTSLYTPPTFLWLNLLARLNPALRHGEI